MLIVLLDGTAPGLTSALAAPAFQKEIDLPELVAGAKLIVRAKYDGEEDSAEHFVVQKVLLGDYPLAARADDGAQKRPPRAAAHAKARLTVYPANSSEQAEDEKSLRETGLSRRRVQATFRPRAPVTLKSGSVYLVFLTPFRDGGREVYEFSAINAYLPAAEAGQVTALLSPPAGRAAVQQPGS